jgi:DNA-binding transcriptional regulator WhiA
MPNDVRKVIEARLDNPSLSLSELGTLLGVSKDDVAGKLRRVKSAVTTGKPINWSVGRPKR